MAFDINRALAAQAEGKAIPVNPALLDRSTPVSVYSPGANRQDAVISQREAMRHSQAYGGDQAIDWVYDCIGLYADPAGSAPFHLEKPDGTKLVDVKRKGTPPDHEVGPADLYRLLRNPNPFMLYNELMSLLVIDLLLVGNAYWIKWQLPSSGRPLALYRLAPSHVKITPGPFGPKNYKYQPPGAKDPLELSLDEVIHFRRPNPHSAYYGMGVIQGSGRAMDLELALTDTVTSYFENKADPSLVLESERRIPRDIRNKLLNQLLRRTSGSRNAGKLLLLENGLKASSLDRSASDSLFDTLSTMSRNRIYSKFRASAKLFGYTDSAGADKTSDARREFDNYALRPFLDRLEGPVSSALTAAWGVNFHIDYRSILPPDDAVKVGGEIAKVPGIKVREIRRQYAQFGIEESTGDDQIDEFVLNMPGPQMDANGQIVDPITGKKIPGQSVNAADRPLPGEPGRPPLGKNTKGFGTTAPKKTGKALIDEIEAQLTILGAGKAVTNAAGENVTIGNKLQGEQRPQDPFASARAVDINLAQATITKGLRDASVALERELLDEVEGKALKTSDIVKRVRNHPAWKTFQKRVEAVLADGARQAALSGVMHTGRTPDDEIDYDEIVQSIVHRPDGLRGIIATAKDRVANKVKEARAASAERHDYEAAIRVAIAEWSAAQASAIADSEATEAYNEAALTAYELTGESEVFVVEEPDAPDQACQDARDSVWSIAHARAHRKEHPRCRRAFLALPAVDSEVA